MKPRGKRGFRLTRFFLITYALLCLFAWGCSDSLIFLPQRASYSDKAPGLRFLETKDGDKVAYFYEPARTGQPTVLFSHGNAEDIGHSLGLRQSLRDRGWGTLAYEYPGYGHSTGEPTEASCLEAIRSAWDFLTVEESVSAGDIILLGRSVGSGPATWLASKESPGALVLVSPFTSAYAVRPPAQYILPGNRFRNDRRIRRSRAPLLVFHGDMDQLIPHEHGKRLFEISPADTKRFVPLRGQGHNDITLEQLVDPMADFWNEL